MADKHSTTPHFLKPKRVSGALFSAPAGRLGYRIEIRCRTEDPDEELALITKVVGAVNAHDDLVAALRGAQRLFAEALPKFDWRKSALDANAIFLLNTVPTTVRAALAKVPA